MRKPKLVHMISLGCPKNMVDSERLLAAVVKLGFIPTLDHGEADLIVVNTCTFILDATKETISEVIRASAERKPGALLAVTGCLPARYGDELIERMPEIDLVLPPDGYESFAKKTAALFDLKEPKLDAPFERWERKLGTPPWRAWLKVAEGCDHKCAYCLIPSLRGPLKARPMDELLEEAEGLAQSGVKELTLVAQDLTAWHDKDLDLADLAANLSAVKDLSWLRLMYAYPERLTPSLIRRLSKIPKLAPYLDVPFQHASPKVQRRMGRKAIDPLAMARRLRELWPGLALRTTLMVGFPGETDEDFDMLSRLVCEAAFDHLGVFIFSPEDGVRASRMPDQIQPVIKERRRRNLMARQRKVSLALNRARVGQEVEVLVEGPSADSDLVMTGRGTFQAPEVDGLIYFDGPQPPAGAIVKARLAKAGPYDMVAALVADEGQS